METSQERPGPESAREIATERATSLLREIQAINDDIPKLKASDSALIFRLNEIRRMLFAFVEHLHQATRETK